MKVAIIGTHFTGKTELAEALFDFLKERDRDAVLIKEVSRRCPLGLGTFEAQIWIMAEQLKEEMEKSGHDIIISDRSVVDNYVYMMRAAPAKAVPLLPFVREYARTYDHIFKTIPLDVPIEPDGFRSTEPAFRNDIERILSKLLNAHGIRHTLLPPRNPMEKIAEVIGL